LQQENKSLKQTSVLIVSCCVVDLAAEYCLASESRAGGRVYIEYTAQKDTRVEEGERSTRAQLRTRRRVSDQRFVAKAQSGNIQVNIID
jgi:hypothetical protein